VPGASRPAELRLLLVPDVLRPERAPPHVSADATRLRDAAAAMAREAGAVLLAGYGRVHAPEKKGRIDLVTEYDRRSEALLVSRIRERFPEHAILAEESGMHAARDTPLPSTEATAMQTTTRWLCDPLDGTTNFAHNYPFFGV